MINRIISIFVIAGTFLLPNISAFSITTDPVSHSITEGTPVNFFVVADSAELTYQWQDSLTGGAWADIAAATDSTYTIATVTHDDSGAYRCIASNGSVMDTSAMATLTVNMAPPMVTTDPIDISVTEGETADFSVVASGDSLTYQWQKDSVDIAGATDSSYTTAATLLADSGAEYMCIVTNPAGSDTSAPAVLSVTPVVPGYPDWLYSSTFKVSTTPEWANLATGMVVDFPIAVTLDESSIDFTQTLAMGADIRFSKEDDTALPYEIESWDATAKTAVIWVLMDTINANEEQTITLHWGKADAVSESNGAVVFASANGYAGVYHMSEDPSGGAGSIIDHSESDFNGTPVGSMDANDVVPGVVGSALDFDGTDDLIDLGDYTANMTAGNSVCGWTNQTELVPWARVVGCGQDVGKDAFYLSNSLQGVNLGYNVNNDTNPVHVEAFDVLTAGEWTYVCGTFDGANHSLYVNGEQAATTAIDTTLNDVTRDECYIGGSTYDWDPTMNGIIDEVQISTIGRSAEWISLSFANQQVNQTLVSSPIPEGCVAEFGVDNDTVQTAEGGDFTVTGNVKCAHRYAWYGLVDGVETPVSFTGMTLTESSGRVTGDSTLMFRFKAEFDTGWASTDVVVEVIENIPDPAFTFTVPDTVWDGNQDIPITATVTNQSAILALPAPYNVILYAWGTAGITVTKTGTTSPIMTLTRAYGDGTFEVRLCLNNGGALVCDTAEMTVLRPVGIEQLEKPKNAIQFQNGVLTWARPASIHIWDINGTLVLQEQGYPGKTVKLHKNIVNGFNTRRYYVRITDLTRQ